MKKTNLLLILLLVSLCCFFVNKNFFYKKLSYYVLTIDSGTGVIDSNGNIRINFNYDNIVKIKKDIFETRKKDKCYLFNLKSNKITYLGNDIVKIYPFYNEYSWITKKNSIAIINEQGDIIHEFKKLLVEDRIFPVHFYKESPIPFCAGTGVYTEFFDFDSRDDTYSLYTKVGLPFRTAASRIVFYNKESIYFEQDFATLVSVVCSKEKGLLILAQFHNKFRNKKINNYGVLNSKGELVLKLNYTSAKLIDENFILVKDDVKYKILNYKGEVISENLTSVDK